MATSTQFLNAMRGFIGIHEVPSGSNRTSIGRAFGWNGVPWCAETISVAAAKVGMGWMHTASTDQMESWGRRGYKGCKWIPANGAARPGDICVWDYRRDGTANHVSVVESVRADGRLVTIGGNESNRVQRAVRSRSHLRGFVRMPFSGAAGTPAPTPQPKSGAYRIGSRGQRVAEIQGLLNFWGWNAGAADGIFGPATSAAVKRAQRALKIPATGIWDQRTQKTYENFVKAMKHFQPKSPQHLNTSAYPTLRKGDRGDFVKLAQKKLGFLIADGSFGELTRLRTLKVQRLKGLTQDGVIGPKTWAAIL